MCRGPFVNIACKIILTSLAESSMSCLSYLDVLCDRKWVAVQLQFCRALLSGIVKNSTQHSCIFSIYFFFYFFIESFKIVFFMGLVNILFQNVMSETDQVEWSTLKGTEKNGHQIKIAYIKDSSDDQLTDAWGHILIDASTF